LVDDAPAPWPADVEEEGKEVGSGVAREAEKGCKNFWSNGQKKFID